MMLRQAAQLTALVFLLSSSGAKAQFFKESLIKKCLLVPVDKLEGGAGKVRLIGLQCGTAGALLGTADRYELRVGSKDDHAVVVKYENDDVTLLRIELAKDGSLVVSDVSDVALAALPAGYRKNFFVVTIDATSFPKDGTVRVVARPKGTGTFGSRQMPHAGGRPKALEATVEI